MKFLRHLLFALPLALCAADAPPAAPAPAPATTPMPLLSSRIGRSPLTVPTLLNARTNPVKLAMEARFDLTALPDAHALRDAVILTGTGDAKRMPWMPPADTERGYTVTFPIWHFAWTEFAIRFTPASNGIVMLNLMGPHQMTPTNSLYRQDVLWDLVTVEGASTITNGGFEETVGNQPVGWVRGGGRANAGPMPPLHGMNYGITWLNATLSTSFQVQAGRPVTVRLHSRSIPPLRYPDLRRIVEKDTVAHQAAAFYKRGVNLGNGLEVPPDQNWAVTHTTNDLLAIKAQGFDHVRIPCGWHHHTGPAPDFKIKPEFFARVDHLITNALNLDLGVILNIHHYDAFTTNPMAESNKLVALWRQINDHYFRAHGKLAFELLNEPKDAATTKVMNPIYEHLLAIIHSGNPLRTVFLGPGRWNSIDELGDLRLPYEDDNIIVTLHSYDPFYFTHQGANWTTPDARILKGIHYPGPPAKPYQLAETNAPPRVQNWISNYNSRSTDINPSSPLAFRAKLDRAAQWSRFYGRPVHLGEFGALRSVDAASRERYLRDFRAACEKDSLGWCVWEWNAGFGYWDKTKEEPVRGMKEALLPPRAE